MSKAKTVVLAFFLSLSAAYVALLPQFYLMYEKGNRYTLGWSSLNRASILIAIGILGAAYGAAYLLLRQGTSWLARRWNRVDGRRLVFDAAAWIVVALVFRSAMAIAFLTEQLPEAALRAVDSPWTKLACYFILPFGGVLFWRSRFEQFASILYRGIAVLFALFLVQVFLWDIYADDVVRRDFPAATPGEAKTGSLYVFLFDEWSYEDSFGHSDFSLANMPHLAELLGHSTLFRQAFSPAVNTGVSIPRFLYQPDERMKAFSYREALARLENNQLLPLRMRSVFDLSDRHFKFVAGTYLHYFVVLGRKVDYIMDIADLSRRYALKDRVRDLLCTQADFLRRAGIRMPFEVRSPLSAAGWMSLTWEYQSRIRPVLNDVLPRLPADNIAFFHLYLPHNPFLFNRDWTLRKPPVYSDSGAVELYHENVYALDAVIGDIVRLLKERGDYDQSMIVITSDHSWKHRYGGTWEELDPRAQISEKHVPLIIKYPGQTRGGEWTEPIGTADLHPQFRDFLNDPGKMRRWVERWNSGEATGAAYVLD